MSEDLEQEELAKTFASCADPATQTIPQEFDRLNQLARAGAKQLSNRCELLNRAWEELTPTLSDMQALLSQRGCDRESQSAAGLPTWTEWLKKFLKETGLGVTLRTVQNHLAKFRGLGKGKTGPSDPSRKLSAKDQRRLLAATQCANELIAALESGTEYRPAMEDYKRVAIGPEKIEQLLDAVPCESVHPIRPSASLPSQGAENAIALVTPSNSESGNVMPLRVALPKPGNWSGLVDYVTGACGDGIKAALAEQDPSQMANCLQHFAQKLTARYCEVDRQRGQIKVMIQYVPASASTGRQAA